MTMEALSSILKKVMERGFNQGFLASRRGDVGTVVSHLLFVDDTLISCDSNKEHLEVLSWMFMWFEVISGLKINLDKSELISMEKVDNTKDLARVARCKVDSLPSTYLGLPLGASFKYAQTWDVVEERFQKKLTLWKRQYFSKGGRLTLIKSTLSSLTHLLHVFIFNPP